MKGFISFPAQGHNGHSIIAAILASHPNIVLANNYSKEISINKIYESAKNDRWDARYPFEIPGQHDIEDKEEVFFLGFSGANPILPEGLEHSPIHVLRNPFDVIGSRYFKFKNRKEDPMDYAIKNYCTRIRETFAQNVFTVVYEDFVIRPYTELNEILEYFCLYYSQAWMTKVIKYVSPNIMRSYSKGAWTKEYIERVHKFILENADNYFLDRTNYHKTVEELK